jgi:CRISPR/Cas system-associated exonuclease Cas4 (RecB family)
MLINKERDMELTTQQIVLLEKAMSKLEAADSYQQSALSHSIVSNDLHERIEDILAEIEMLIEEAEMVDTDAHSPYNTVNS